jgi:hypothetical protein
MTISYYGDVVCKMYYDSVKGYTLNCKRVPDLDFDIKSAIKDVFDEHGIIVERFGRSTNKESTLKEDYKNDLKKFVDANLMNSKQLVQNVDIDCTVTPTIQNHMLMENIQQLYVLTALRLIMEKTT